MISFILFCITSCIAQDFNQAPAVNSSWTANALAGQSTPGSPDIRGCNDRNDWAVSYDDGPGPETPRVLQELRQRQIKATFFVVGKQVRDHPNVLKRAYDEGHEIALHSW